MKTFYRLLYCILVLIAISAAAFAGNSGKIVGKVVDEKNQPIIGAIIQVLGTQRGASTDIDGKYEIIGVAVGSYSVRASGLDYDTVTATDVKVNDNQTTPQNFKLTTGGVGLKEVLVTADAKLVNNLSTTGTQTVTSKTIDAIPNVKNVQDVLALQAGVVKSGGSVFLRGGRANEVQYLVDGVPTNDIVNNTSIYSNANSQIANLQASGINASTGGLTVSASAIQSVSVQSSGFDADYGNAQSGIVSITTKSGADSYSGGAQFRTDKIAKPNQDEVFSSVNFGGPEPITRYLLPSLGATIPGNLTFFLSSDVDRNDGPYNYAQNQFFNPEHHKIEFNGFLGGLLQGAGFSYADNQVNTFTLDSKLNYNIGADQATYSYRASLGTNHNL
ncbi:MAG TPA: carboxypeptidase regulatory-like domain-containing protein, partial [Bacteroidota bacterium]|nr:carboxypeptidase regulatory-like domain-containing protein [Bacteroidota bacterium]